VERAFQINQTMTPAGDQPTAIATLNDGINGGLAYQTLLGVTGSGKTFTIANIVQEHQRPAMILAPNKTLAAQLYGEMKEFFPNNAVEYFVSYYDYYQPEAYVPASDLFIEKDASVNEHIEQMRLSATKTLFERRDAVIVATVSSIYGLGDPQSYHKMVLHLARGSIIDQRQLLRRLAELQYTRNDMELGRGCYRVRGEIIDIHPAESDGEAVRVELFDDEIESLRWFDPLTGEILRTVPRLTIYPKTHYVTPRDVLMVRFDEFEAMMPQTVFVSATPSDYEARRSDQVAEQVVRPTGLLDPEVEVRPVSTQVDDLLSEIGKVVATDSRVLVTTLTKRMSEDLTDYLAEHGVKVRYLHSDIDTVERVEIIRDLRLGEFDVLVGINLLREGLDMPEVSLVAILDADKEGFLRSERSLIQTIGRAARNVEGRAILYADWITGAMKTAMAETERRREKQRAHNTEHGIDPPACTRKPATSSSRKRQHCATRPVHCVSNGLVRGRAHDTPTGALAPRAR